MSDKQYCVTMKYGSWSCSTYEFITDDKSKAENFLDQIRSCQNASPTSNKYYQEFDFGTQTRSGGFQNRKRVRAEGKFIQDCFISVIEKTNDRVSGNQTPLGSKMPKDKKENKWFGW